MGRRRKRSNSDAEGDSLEKQYIIRRQQSLKQNKSTTSESSQVLSTSSQTAKKTTESDNDPCHKECSSGEKKEKKEKNVSTQDSASPNNETEHEKIERLRLKKRRKKELQKEKKRVAAEKLAAEMETQKKEKEDKKKKENEDVKKNTCNPNRFITTHRGVQYCDIVVGRGPVVQDRKKVRVSYKLRAKHKTGKVLDSSSNFGFRVGKGEVISGWEIGLLRMRQGGTRHLIIPPNAGYGNKNIGAGSGALLYFEVTLLSC